MPALLELLYREYCRARLAEMRKQLLLTGKHAGDLDYDSADADSVDGADTQADVELNRARK